MNLNKMNVTSLSQEELRSVKGGFAIMSFIISKIAKAIIRWAYRKWRER